MVGALDHQASAEVIDKIEATVSKKEQNYNLSHERNKLPAYN